MAALDYVRLMNKQL